MLTVAIALGVGILYIAAYHTYGRWLARKLFQLRPDAVTPAVAQADGRDYVPTRREVIFGHHFTSIAGTGPIVGPALAIYWGWLPALLWVLFGSILMGAVHDFSALVISLRSQGRSVGDVIGDLVGQRARFLFFLVIFFALLIVIAIFGLVIAVLFNLYPESVFPVWMEIPIAVAVGWIVARKTGWNLTVVSVIALGVMYVTVGMGALWGAPPGQPAGNAMAAAQTSLQQQAQTLRADARDAQDAGKRQTALTAAQAHTNAAVMLGAMQQRAGEANVSYRHAPHFVHRHAKPTDLPDASAEQLSAAQQAATAALRNELPKAGALSVHFTWRPIVVWTLILLVYAFIASILPVQTLLQPRDFINSHQLFFAVGLVIFAMLWTHPPLDTGLAVTGAGRAAGDSSAPPFWPFLFITIACGAISGFHCLVSSGTTSKQVRSEPDAQFVGYGSMLSEGMLATVVILACTAGLAYGVSQQFPGAAPFEARYASWSAASGLGAKVGAFVDGAAFMIAGAFAWTGLPTEALVNLGLAVMGVFVVSFAATTLDTATRLQRYVIGELGHASRIKLLTNRYVATTIAVVTAAALALHDGQGKGGLALWPLFGIVNQLLAALGLLTATVWLYRRAKPVWFTLLPMLFMVVLTGWAMTIKLGDWYGWAAEAGLKGVVHGKSGAAWAMLAAIGTLIMVLEVWMLIESVLVWLRLRRLPPDQRLDKPSRTIEPAAQSAPVGVAD